MSQLHKYNIDDDATGHMLFEEMRSKSSQAPKHEYVDNDSETDRKYYKCPEHESLKKKVENCGKKFQLLENMITEALKGKPDSVQVKLESLKIDMDILKVQLARLKFYQLLALVFVMVSLFVGCMIYKKLAEEDYKMVGKIYSEGPIEIP